MAFTVTTTEFETKLTETYKMLASCSHWGQDVTFFGTELECYRIGYKMRAKGEYRVAYSENMQTWYCCFPYWFDIETSQRIIEG